MILELLIGLEIIAFLFLALGILPFKKMSENENLPLVNKVIFIFVSAIIFFSLAISAVSYDYTYCFVNETSINVAGNSTISTATCAEYNIEDQGVAYLNYGMGIISILVGIILLIVVALSKNDQHYMEE